MKDKSMSPNWDALLEYVKTLPNEENLPIDELMALVTQKHLL